MTKRVLIVLGLVWCCLTAGCGGGGGNGGGSTGQSLSIQIATSTMPAGNLIVHNAVMQLAFDGKVIGQTTSASYPPFTRPTFDYETFTVPNVTPGKHVFTVTCISSTDPKMAGGGVDVIYPSNVTADIGNFGINYKQEVTVNLTVT